MSGNSHPVVKLGLELLNTGIIEPEKRREFSEAFSVLGIDSGATLELAGLRSIFSDLSDSPNTAKYYLPCGLDPETINYPDQGIVPRDFSSVKPSNTSSQNALVQLERFGSFVATSADQQTPVYDLFKSVAAVYDCLKNPDAETDKKCLLVGCDFSGIQDTVYTISSKGALKTLRARSFMLELLTEHIIYEILDASKAGRHAVIYSGGGGFGLLLPNTDSIEKTIKKYSESLNKWALKEFMTRLFIAIDLLPFGVEKLRSPFDFQELRQDQADNLDRLKRQKFVGQLDQLFQPEMPEQLTVHTECQITRRDDLRDDQMRDIGLSLGERMTPENKNQEGRIWVSESCFRQFNFGDALADLESGKAICRSSSESFKNKACFKIPDINWTDEDEARRDNYAYYCLSNSSGSKQIAWKHNDWSGDRTLLYANYVRKYEGLSSYAKEREKESLEEEGRGPEPDHTATFQGLASSSCGADLIGALRMDVDDMGNMFSKVESLVILSAKSRMLNLFFKVYLNQICAASSKIGFSPTDIVGKGYDEGRNVSVVYAGGDDLFIVGAWDETTELAFDIQQAFDRFTQGCGISGGLTLHQPKFPLYQMARKSGEAEHVAKYDRPSKNLFTPFLLNVDNGSNKLMRVINWDDSMFFNLLDWLVSLTDKERMDGQINAITLGAVSKGFIYKLFDSAKEWAVEEKMYLPRLRYYFSKLEQQYEKDSYKMVIDSLRKNLFSSSIKLRENSVRRLILVLNWFEQLQRSK